MSPTCWMSDVSINEQIMMKLASAIGICRPQLGLKNGIPYLLMGIKYDLHGSLHAQVSHHFSSQKRNTYICVYIYTCIIMYTHMYTKHCDVHHLPHLGAQEPAPTYLYIFTSHKRALGTTSGMIFPTYPGNQAWRAGKFPIYTHLQMVFPYFPSYEYKPPFIEDFN